MSVCPVRLEVRTSGFHPENRSSILLRDARSAFGKGGEGSFFIDLFGDGVSFFHFSDVGCLKGLDPVGFF